MAFEPLIYENVSLQLAGVQYGDEVDSVVLTPTTTKYAWAPVSGANRSKVRKPTWQMTLNVGQSFDRAALSAQLIQRHGEAVPFVLTPSTGGTEKVEGTVVLEAVQLGGGTDGIASSGATLDVDGQPKFTWRTTPAGA